MNDKFEKWLSDWSEDIFRVQEFTKSDLPSNSADIQADLSRTTREGPHMAELLAEIENQITQSRAMETLSVKSDPKFKDLSAPERKTIVESRLADMSRVRDILKATIRALHDRNFSLLSQRAFERETLRLGGHEG